MMFDVDNEAKFRCSKCGNAIDYGQVRGRVRVCYNCKRIAHAERSKKSYARRIEKLNKKFPPKIIKVCDTKEYRDYNKKKKTMSEAHNLFIVLKDEDGIHRPMAFITPLDDAGEMRAREYKLEKGCTLVVVEIKEIKDYE